MIYDCEHEPKIRIHGGEALSVCAECHVKNIELFHRGDSPSWQGMRHFPSPAGRRVRTFRYQSLHEPTMEDLV